MNNPQELGLPKKFISWRPWQPAVINKAYEVLSGEKCFLLDAPTGSGKSLMGMAIYKRMMVPLRVMRKMKGRDYTKGSMEAGRDMQEPRTIYLTNTKQLQTQLLNEFPEVKTVYGRSNYPCMLHKSRFPSVTAEDCLGKKCPEGAKAVCLYLRAKEEAASSPVVVLNNMYFLTEANNVGMFSKNDLLIVDEIDCLESVLEGYIGLSFTEKKLEELGITVGSWDSADYKAWLSWFSTERKTILDLSSKLEDTIENESFENDVEIELQKRLKSYKDFVKKINIILNGTENWLLSSVEDTAKYGKRWTFKPISIAPYAWQYVWKHTDLIFGMSGSILDPKVLKEDLGIQQEVVYNVIPSPFPEKNRQIFYHPEVNLTAKRMNDELPRLAAAVSGLLDKYPKDKVLIHTVNYNVKMFLMEHLPKHEKRLISHITEDRNMKLSYFKSSRDPLVMISPSFDRGVDLPDDCCRCIIICKMPYLRLDPQVMARVYNGSGRMTQAGGYWYSLKAAQTLLQMTGRAVRSMTDYCDTYILDSQFQRLMGTVRPILPDWWKNAIRVRQA